MKKLSIVAILAMSMVNTAMAEVKTEVNGQAVFYYQTNNNGANNFLDQASSSASAGLELQTDIDFGNDFEFTAQGTYLGTLGLEKDIISNSRQNAKVNDKNDVALTKLFLSKKIANTKLKIGRQELSQSLSPFAFSEGWNVFTNRFDALILENEDLSNTKILAGYIYRSNRHNGLNNFDDLLVDNSTIATPTLNNGAYMLTVANESVKNLPITASFYNLQSINNSQNGDAIWLDVKQKEYNLALQGGRLNPRNATKATTAYGAKVSAKLPSRNIVLAYSGVNNGESGLRNIGTGIKTPLYTQIIGNQNFISNDNDTLLLKTTMKLPTGKLSLAYDYTKDNSIAKNDYQELDVVYKFDALGTKMLLAYIGQKTKNNTFGGEKDSNNLRFWTRYNF